MIQQLGPADQRVEVWLVRHGETTFTVQRRIAGWSDPPLTELGASQAASLRPFLAENDFCSVWCSDLERTRTTAALAWGEASSDVRLRELNFGELEGRPYEEVSAAAADVFLAFRDFETPGGEDRSTFEGRVRAFLNALEPGRHLIFTHGGVIRLFTQDHGVDRFLATGSVVGLDWSNNELLFVRELENGTPVLD